MIYTVYKVTNRVNGKVYIGYTSLNPEKRFNQHRQYAFNTNRKGKLLYSAVAKYGPDAFDFEVIYQSRDMEHALAMETHFITEYRAWVDFPDANGYNLTLGGRQAVKSRKSIEAQRAKMLGRKQDPEHASKKGFGVCPNPSYKGMPGRPHTDVTRVKMAEAQSKWEWTVTQPDGIVVVVRNLSQFCRDKDINRPNLLAASKIGSTHFGYSVVRSGGEKHHQEGRKLTAEEREKIGKVNKKTYHLIDKNNVEYVTDDLPDFAGRHGFNKDTIRNYSRRGDRLKGWFIVKTVDTKGREYVYGQK